MMTEVTAEMIERGRGGDPRLVLERRRLAMKVREAREKLTSSGSGHRTFDVELLRLYAERRKGSALGLAALGLAVAMVALQWAPPRTIAVWLALNAAAQAIGYVLANLLLRKAWAAINVRHWGRLFMAAEAVQGIVWSLVAGSGTLLHVSRVPAFTIVALLLVAAMNATAAATVPTAVYCGLLPIALAILALLRPTSLSGDSALLAGIALTSLLYFASMARQVYFSSMQGLSFQADKDELIAELEQSQTNSDLARRRAEESNLAKSRFLATMSHELRTPLNAILGFSEVMKAELFGAHAVPAYKDYSDDIHSSGQHLLMLINEILDLSRVEAGRYELREESVDMQGVIDECRHLVTLRARKKDIVIARASGSTCRACGRTSARCARWRSTCCRTPSSSRRRAGRSASRSAAHRRAASSSPSRTPARAFRRTRSRWSCRRSAAAAWRRRRRKKARASACPSSRAWWNCTAARSP